MQRAFPGLCPDLTCSQARSQRARIPERRTRDRWCSASFMLSWIGRVSATTVTTEAGGLFSRSLVASLFERDRPGSPLFQGRMPTRSGYELSFTKGPQEGVVDVRQTSPSDPGSLAAVMLKVLLNPQPHLAQGLTAGRECLWPGGASVFRQLIVRSSQERPGV